METMEDLLKDFEENKVKAGDIVTGEVVSIPSDTTAYVNVGAFTEGTLHLDHFTKNKDVTSFKGILNVGDKIKVKVTTVKEESIYLSCLDIPNEKVIEELQNAFDNGTLVNVNVTKSQDGKGYNAEYKGQNVFIPRSLSAADVKVGATVEVKLVTLDVTDKKVNVVASRRDVVNAIYEEERAKELEGINVGDVLTGKIIKVEKYGAIVKFNYVTGLMLAAQVSHKFVDIQKELTVGEDIEVKVIKKENGKLELSHKATTKSPFELYAEAHKVSDKVKGKVSNKLQFGLLIELADDVKGLLHQSEYSHNPNDNYANCVKIGDEVEVAIIAINAEKEKISLSRKALLDNPWDKVSANVGDKVSAKISEVNEKGLKVEALGVDGFVPKSEALADKGELKDFFFVGDMIDAVVTEIKPKEWRLKLSIRKLKEAEERKEFEKHLTSDDEAVTIGDALNIENK